MAKGGHDRTLVLASSNPGKLREIEAMLGATDLVLLPQGDFGIGDTEETGLSFVENAILKARQAARRSGLPAIADDSGLEVDALDGAPGIRSARYAGPSASDSENVAKLLRELAGVPWPERTARFQCLMVYLRHGEDPTPAICQGTWPGRILPEPRGVYGFGYDPVFFVPDRGVSAAELEPPVKNALSHRSRALRRLIATLKACP